jgi:tRNA G26 N,N-dimethylase Trm1
VAIDADPWGRVAEYVTEALRVSDSPESSR